MTSMGDVVTGALKRLRVINPRKTPDGAAGSEGLTALNEMMHSWKAEGVDTDHDTLAASDDFPLDDEHIQGVKALLAVRLASDYGMDIDAGIGRDAEMGWAALQAEYIEPAGDASLDAGLIRTLHGRWGVS
jgi:hypothetical protein